VWCIGGKHDSFWTTLCTREKKILTTEILLLYADGYREAVTPGAPDVRQSDPPTVPITTLYPEGNYPVGKEEPYTVGPCSISVQVGDLYGDFYLHTFKVF